MEKKKWWVSALKFIGVNALKMIITNQKGIKGTDNVNKVNDVIDRVNDNI